jgi:hypothetical protein
VNSPATLHKLAWNGASWTPTAADGWAAGKALRYPGNTGNPDAEGVTRADLADPAIYVAAERNNAASGVSRLSVLRFDPTGADAPLVATHEWNLTGDLPAVGPNLGFEAITWIPDAHLVARGFFDERAGAPYAPAAYPGHGAGLFFLGVEGTGAIHAYALDQTGGTFARIATIASGHPGVMGLEFDRAAGALWAVCDDTCAGQINLLQIDATPGTAAQGRFRVAKRFARPAGMPNVNNEGFAIAPAAECSGGLKAVFWSDDGNTDGHALRRGFLPCGPL